MKTQINPKKVILALLLAASSTLCFAQCDKTATLTSSATNYLDDKGNVTKSMDEETVVTITKTSLTIIPGNDSRKASDPLTSNSCNWTTPYKEGKTTLTSTLTNEAGRELHAKVVIEGKGGKVTLTFEAAEMPGRKIMVTADKFE